MSVSVSLSRIFPALIAGTVLAMGMAACSGGDATRDASSLEVTASGDADVFSLRIGDCFNDVDNGEISEVPVVPCSDPHDNEVFHQFEMPDGDVPSDAAFDEAAAEACVPEFEAFVGIGYMDSTLDYFTITPTQHGWENLDDRQVVCSVYDPEGQTSGSLRGAAR